MPTKPSAPRPYSPTPRDEAIYRAVTIAGLSQEQAAAENGVTQPTVSRAVKRYAAWRASTDPQDSGDLTLRQQERLDRWLSHERHEQIYAQALRLARRMEQPAVTTRQGNAGDKQFTYEARKDQHAAAARFLRTAQRSADALTRLAANSPLNQEPLEEYTLRQALVALREKVESRGAVPASNNPHHTVDRWLRALLGREMFSHPAHMLAPGSALGELIRAALANCHSSTPEQLLQDLANNPPPCQPDDDDFNNNDDTDTTPTRSASEQLPPKTENRKPKTPTIPDPSSPTPSPEPPAPIRSPHKRITPPHDPKAEPASPPPTPTPSTSSTTAGTPRCKPRPQLPDDSSEKNIRTMPPTDKWAYADDPLGRLYRRLDKQLQERTT